MQSHLTLLADGKPLALNPDQSIDITLQNPLFNDTEMFSYPFSLPIEGNRQYVQNIDNPDATLRAVDLEHTPMQILADGLPLASGTSVLSDGESITDTFSMQVNAATRSFQDLIGTLQCRDLVIPAKYREQCRIGEKIGNLRVSVVYDTEVTVEFSGKKGPKHYGTAGNGLVMADTFEPQALGFSYPGKCQETSKDGYPHIAVLHEERPYDGNHKVIRPKSTVSGHPGASSYINTNAAYLETNYNGQPAVFCNARIAYKHYDIDDDGKTSSGVVQFDEADRRNEIENHGHYWVLDADRPQSGICFYVLFFLDVLFDNLGVQFDNSALTAIQDMKHLCFFTTRCKYDTEVLHRSSNRYGDGDLYQMPDGNTYVKATLEGDSSNYTVGPGSIRLDPQRDANGNIIRDSNGNPVPITYKPCYEKTVSNPDGDCDKAFEGINLWLSSRGCGAQLSLPKPVDKSVQSLKFTERDRRGNYVQQKIVTVEDPDVQSITIRSTITQATASANIMAMFANAENFPDTSVSDILDSLQNAFGIKFDYDYEKRKVTAYLLRDVFRRRNSVSPIPMSGKFDNLIPVSEKITGFRQCYSAESDTKEQRQNVKQGTRDYDTSYDYIEYNDPLAESSVNPYGTERSKVNYNFTFDEISRKLLSNTDMTCYIDRTTGNAYRIKVDADAATAEEMKPVLFEVGQWKGVEYGDCSEENEDFVQEFSIGFTPVDFNDVNSGRHARGDINTTGKLVSTDGDSSSNGNTYDIYDLNFDQRPMLAAFCSEDMEHEFVEQHLNNILSSSVADIYVQTKLKLVESYDPTKTDDGNSPLQHFDWGMAIALMRGGGSDATVSQYDYNYDGFGNSKWQMISGNYALASDTLDHFGNAYDYNGSGFMWTSINGTYHREVCKSLIFANFPNSNANLVAPTRKVSGDYAHYKGWDVDEDDFCTYISSSSQMRSGDGKDYEVLYVVIQDDGTVLTPTEVRSYWNNIQDKARVNKTSIKDEDAKQKRLFVRAIPVGMYEEIEALADFLHQLGAVVYGSSDSGLMNCRYPIDNGIGAGERFSLKIRAFKDDLAPWAKERNITLCDPDRVNADGSITKIRTRGLFDSFLIDFAYFLTHRHRFKIPCTLSAAQIADIPNHWRDWYIINDRLCLINTATVSVNAAEGINNVELEVFSL